MIEALPPSLSLSGHDAYCHVCWYSFYSLWVAKEPPPNTCIEGASQMIDCHQAMARARLSAFLANERAAGRLPHVKPAV